MQKETKINNFRQRRQREAKRDKQGNRETKRNKERQRKQGDAKRD